MKRIVRKLSTKFSEVQKPFDWQTAKFDWQVAPCPNKFAILVHFVYFTCDPKRSAGEQLPGWSFWIVSKM